MIPNAYPTLDFDLGDTADMLRDSVRSFVGDKIAPLRRRDRQDEHVPPPSVAADGRARLVGHHGRRGIRRHGLRLSRTLRRDGRNQPRLGRNRTVLRRAFQSLREPDPPQRHDGAEAPLSAEADFRRACGRAGDERIRLGLRCRLDAFARREARLALRAERHEDVDHQRSAGRHTCRLCEDRYEGRSARHHRVPHRKGLQGILARRRSSTSSACAAPIRPN